MAAHVDSPLGRYGALEPGRAGWRQALLALTTPAVRRAALGPWQQPATSSTSDGLATWWELLTRPLWGLAALREHDLWPTIRATIARAVDPDDDWYIGGPRDRHQCLVESAAVGYALTLAPQHLWDPLTDRQKKHLGTWLAKAAAADPVDNNWHYFPVLAGHGLDHVGFPRDTSTDKAHLARLDSFALTDGWYQDGFTDRCDYYNPFGFHFYNLLLNRGHEQAAAFARQFQFWFAADGSAVPFGRSLGYRMAQGAFWGALAYADVEALPWQDIRGLAQRQLEWWWQQPVLDGDGLLSVGYVYPNHGVVEQYMGGGSPYWGTKFFLPLTLEDDHPFWAAEPRPVLDGVSPQPAPRAVLSRCDGEVTLLNGQGWADWARGGTAKYAKFAYSTSSGFSVSLGEHTLEHGAFDSTLALSDDDGRRWRTREEALESYVDGDVVYSRWRPWPDVEIETWLKPGPRGWHVRLHRIVTARALRTAEGGFARPWTDRTPPSRATGLVDLRRERHRTVITPLAGTNVLHPRTALPMLLGELSPGVHWLSTAARA
ncbi:DUF2264 domain-containing protein [Catelliglobosispora koreensis]|uniref:DUF2264 domain-containing protein n=1 Tax=Catelliglobosispora koreensis TaxID=129052 RepID=UPI0003806C3B|nr:DUF2264 domain-containing protein [Catelliglobosispora koreensis]